MGERRARIKQSSAQQRNPCLHRETFPGVVARAAFSPNSCTKRSVMHSPTRIPRTAETDRVTGQSGSNCRNQAWVLKNPFQGNSAAKFVRKLLIVRSPWTPKFTEITALVPFSTPTPGFANNNEPSLWRVSLVSMSCFRAVIPLCSMASHLQSNTNFSVCDTVNQRSQRKVCV